MGRKKSVKMSNSTRKSVTAKRVVEGSEMKVFFDNKGIEYDYAWAAKLSSFYNFFVGCLKMGFPVLVTWLWYPAWAFYPFFFVRKNLKSDNPISVLNHERIHVVQQREIHSIISFPLLVVAFWHTWLFVVIPFIPTIFYLLEFLRVMCINKPKVKLDFKELLKYYRMHTCFEAEANVGSMNYDYLLARRPFAFLGYMQIKIFQKLSIPKKK